MQTDAPTLDLEILGSPKFHLAGGGPKGGNGLARNPMQTDTPTLDLEILGNPMKAMGIFESSLREGSRGE